MDNLPFQVIAVSVHVDAGSLALLTQDQMMHKVLHAAHGRPWKESWLPSLDRLDVRLLVAWTDLRRELTSSCLLCDSKPQRLLLIRCFGAAPAPSVRDRCCTRDSFGPEIECLDEHVCPCLMQYGMLHVETLALQLARTFD